MSKARLKFLLICLHALLGSCTFGSTEVVDLNSVGLVVDASTYILEKEQLIEPGDVFVWKGERLMTFDLGTHSILLEGNARTFDSTIVKYQSTIDYQFQKNQIISLYKKFGRNYEELLVSPETKRILREAIARHTSLDKVNTESLEDSLRYFYDSHYLVFVSVKLD